MRALFVVLGCMIAAPSTRAQDVLLGAIVRVGEADGPAALAGAREAGGARWRLVSPVLGAEPSNAPPTDALQRIHDRDYLEGSFATCLTALQAPELDVSSLLSAGHRDAAGHALLLAGACALLAGDEPLARRRVASAAIADVPLGQSERTTPEFQQLVEDETARVRTLPSYTIALKTDPENAQVRVDGADSCQAPCTLSLREGNHLLRLERPGSVPRDVSLEVSSDRTLELRLDPAPAPLMRQQLADAIGAGPLDRVEVAELAASAHGARVVVLLERRGARVAAALFDRGLHRFVARVADDTARTRVAVHQLVDEWRGIVEPTPVYRRASFWLLLAAGVIVVGAAVGVSVWRLTLDPRVTNEFVVPE